MLSIYTPHSELHMHTFSPNLYLEKLAMHSLAAASRPRLSETEPKWSVFDTMSVVLEMRAIRFGQPCCA